MRANFYTVLAYGTLFVDAYLALASVAIRMMNREYSSYLLPFGTGKFSGEQRFLVLIIATWTAALALGCLKLHGAQKSNHTMPGIIWFILILSVVWLIHGVPLMLNFAREVFVFARELFVRGL